MQGRGQGHCVAPHCHCRPHGHSAICRRFPPCEQSLAAASSSGVRCSGRPGHRASPWSSLSLSMLLLFLFSFCSCHCHPSSFLHLVIVVPTSLFRHGPCPCCRCLCLVLAILCCPPTPPLIYRSSVWQVLGQLHRQQF